METYKLFKLYEQSKQQTLSQVESLFGKDATHYLHEQIIAIRYNEQEHTVRDILCEMAKLDVRQAMFTSSTMRNIINHFGKERCPMVFQFTDNVSEDLFSILNGYLKRVESESNELLRIDDLRHLLTYLRMLSVEADIDIQELSISYQKDSLMLYNNGIVKASSKEALDQLIEVSFQE